MTHRDVSAPRAAASRDVSAARAAASLDVSAATLDVSAASLDVSAASLDVSAASLDVSAASLELHSAPNQGTRESSRPPGAKLTRLAWLLCAALTFASALPAQAAEPTPESAFAEANQRYFAGDWQGARDLYQRLLERFEIEDAGLYHNLGNASFRSGAYGSAILYYRRAQALEPSGALADALDKNLDAARRTLQARYRAGSDSALVYASPADALYQATHVVGEAPLAIAFLVTWLSLFALLIVRRLRPHTRWPGRLAIAAGVLALLSGLLLWGRVASEASHQLAVVVASDALLRDGRHELAQGRELAEGLEVKIVDAEGQWLQVELASGKRGWVSAAQVKQI